MINYKVKPNESNIHFGAIYAYVLVRNNLIIAYFFINKIQPKLEGNYFQQSIIKYKDNYNNNKHLFPLSLFVPYNLYYIYGIEHTSPLAAIEHEHYSGDCIIGGYRTSLHCIFFIQNFRTIKLSQCLSM